jgi:hypothetical protein
VSTPVIFIHGLWLHASSWEPWLERFAAAGYAPTAPGWPDEPATVEAARAEPERLAGRASTTSSPPTPSGSTARSRSSSGIPSAA